MNKVLIIDDEEKLRQLLTRIISLEGFTVLEASNLATASTVLAKENIAVILCDVKLPDGNGVDFVKQVKPKYPAIEIILLTAYGNIPDDADDREVGRKRQPDFLRWQVQHFDDVRDPECVSGVAAKGCGGYYSCGG